MEINNQTPIEVAEDLLASLTEEYQNKVKFITDFICKYSKREPIRAMLIVTNELGHKSHTYIVNTNAVKHCLRLIDMKHGMKNRFEFTSIEQMREGAVKEGFIFEIVIERSEDVIIKPSEGLIYYCNYGNY